MSRLRIVAVRIYRGESYATFKEKEIWKDGELVKDDVDVGTDKPCFFANFLVSSEFVLKDTTRITLTIDEDN
jgi:hypothetical protein